MTTPDTQQGPWRAVLSMSGYVLPSNELGVLRHDDPVHVDLRRGDALPDDEDRLPSTYTAANVIELDLDLYAADDPAAAAVARWRQANAMAFGLNAKPILDRWQADPGAWRGGAADVLEELLAQREDRETYR